MHCINAIILIIIVILSPSRGSLSWPAALCLPYITRCLHFSYLHFIL